MLYFFSRMKPDEAEKLHREVEDQIALREGRKNNPEIGNPDQDGGGQPEEGSCLNQGHETEGNGDSNPEIPVEPEKKATVKFWKKSDPKSEADNDIDVEKNETASKHGLGKKCLIIFKLFVKTFGLIFLAEWGDRSQLATIVMASVNDVAGIILGSVAGHTVCTSLAVLAGALVAKKIGVRMITVIGGFVFVGFAIASIVMGPE